MKGRAPILLLGVALAASAALLLHFDSQLTFIGDGWELLINRPGWSTGTFLEPFNENLILGPALVYKLLLELFGMDSALPFYLVSISFFLLSAVALFAYVRRRMGPWPALVAAVLILFLGAAHEDLFWAFQMGFFASVAAGLGMLLALDREDRRGDRVACCLLLVSLAFGSVGLAFVAAGLADLAMGRRPRARRAYVTLLPLAAYALWWLTWGHTVGDQVSMETVGHVPGYAFDAAAAGTASLLGREPIDGSGQPLLICRVLVGLLLVAGLVTIGRRRQVSRGLTLALALALAYWTLIGLDRTADRFALSSRYQYPSAVFLLLIAAEMLRGARIPRPAIGVTAAVVAAAVFGGIGLMDRHHHDGWKPMADQIRLTLTAVDVAGANARGEYAISFPPSMTLPASKYLEARKELGSPALDEDELLTRPWPERRDADRTLAAVEGVALTPARGRRWNDGCPVASPLPVRAGSAVELQPGTMTLENKGPRVAAVRLGRFARGFPIALGNLRPGEVRSLSIPTDNSPQPWRLIKEGKSELILSSSHEGRTTFKPYATAASANCSS